MKAGSPDVECKLNDIDDGGIHSVQTSGVSIEYLNYRGPRQIILGLDLRPEEKDRYQEIQAIRLLNSEANLTRNPHA